MYERVIASNKLSRCTYDHRGQNGAISYDINYSVLYNNNNEVKV